jgi:hypothetical protein
MLVRFTKGSSPGESDTLTCVRPDGSTTWAEMTRQGILPHDAFHFVIENTLGWRDAFFGQVAQGGSIEAVTAKLHGKQAAWSKMPQAFQAESLIECLEADQWNGAADPAEFAQKLILACRRRGVAPPDINPEELSHVRAALREFGAAWRPLTPGASLERTF